MRAGKTAREQSNGNGKAVTFNERVAAAKLGISYPTLLRRRKSGDVVYYRLGSKILYDDHCIEETLKRSRRPVAA